MMAQYLEVKRAHPDCLVFYRMGDFYELFFEDAVAAAKALDIALTQRGKHNGAEVPMCGVPAHSHEAYLARLIRQGFKVALCDQIEDAAEAKKRGGKALVRRSVVRVVTPGTLTEEQLLDARRANYLAALADAGGSAGPGLARHVDRRVLGRAGRAGPLAGRAGAPRSAGAAPAGPARAARRACSRPGPTGSSA